jgi:glycine/D-amino acid oxidase-like deaminating enzyme
MKLTWGQLFWPTQSDARVVGPPESDLECDVSVVGAGVTGALIADALARAGRDVVVIDKREPGWGSTGASTSLVLYELDTPLIELERLVGSEDAREVYRMGVGAIGKLEELVASLGDDCGFCRRESIYLCSDDSDFPELRAEFEARKRADLRVDLVGREDLRSLLGFERAGAIISHDAAEVDPYRLTQALLGRAMSRGMRLFGRCELMGTKIMDGGAVARTSSGCSIRARTVVYATGYEAAAMIGGNLSDKQVTYAAVSEHVEDLAGWWKRALIWETARPYLYLRTTSDRRAMIGGLDDREHGGVSDETHLRRKAAQLKEEFENLFPEIPFVIDAAWAGVFETTPDGMPYIGGHPNFPNSMFALGYGGNGLTFAVIAAEIIGDGCRGVSNEGERLFRFGREKIQARKSKRR